MEDKQYTNYIPFLIVGLIVIRFVGGLAFAEQKAPTTAVLEKSVRVATTTAHNPFETIDIQGAAAFVFDVRTGETFYTKNADAQLPLASLTKLMTAMIALETLPSNQTIFITPEALAEDGENGLIPFEQWSRDDLIDITLISSSNDGAHALAGAIAAFNKATDTQAAVSLMNTRAQELGLTQTHFLNETGLDINNETDPGAVGSARDVARVLVYMLRNTPELLEPTRNGALTLYSLNAIPHTFDNTNAIANTMPWLIGSKTGFTDNAGGNLAVIFDAGLARPVIAVVLGSTKDGRFQDIQTISESTLEYLQSQG